MGMGCSTQRPFHGSFAAMGLNSAQMCPDMAAGGAGVTSAHRFGAPGPAQDRRRSGTSGMLNAAGHSPETLLKQELGKAGVVERAAAVGASGQRKGALGHG